MAGKVGEAFVEVVADYKEFARKATTELNVLLKRLGAQADFDPLTESSGDAGEESAREYNDRFERETNRSTQRTRRKRLGERMGRDIVSAVGDGIDRDRDRKGNILTRLFGGGSGGEDGNRLQRMFAGIGGSIGSTVGSVFGVLAQGAGSALSAVGSLSTSILTFLAVAALIAPLIYVATAALVSMSGALIPLTVGFGLLLGIFPVLMAAFSGFGEALGAIADGDVKKIDEALQKLSPSARAVAKDFQGLWPELKKVQQVIQESFFAPLVGDLGRIGDKLLPKITPGLERIATLLGNMASTFLEKLSSPNGIKFFETALGTIGDIIEKSGPGLENLFTALGNVFVASLPFAEKLFTSMGDGLTKFAEFINTKVADGSFERFLESSLETGGEFVGVIKELLALFGALFEDTDEGGKRFLKDIREALGALTQFFKSKDGKAALQAMIDLAKFFGVVLIGTAYNVGQMYRALKTALAVAKQFWEWLGKVYDRAAKLSAPGIAGAIRGLKGIPFFAKGGVVDSPTLGVIGEAGAEAVVPLTDPDRARDVMRDAGLLDLAAGMGGGGDTTVVVYLGTEQITDILDMRVDRGIKRQGKLIATGTREG